MTMVVDGDILLVGRHLPTSGRYRRSLHDAAVACARLSSRLRRVNNPDAWDTGAAEPGVAIDLDRQLDGTEFASAYA